MYPLTRTGVLTNLEYDFVSIKLQWTTSICNLLIFLNVETFKYIFRTKVTAYTRPGAYKYEKIQIIFFYRLLAKKELQKNQLPKNRKNHNILVSYLFLYESKNNRSLAFIPITQFENFYKILIIHATFSPNPYLFGTFQFKQICKNILSNPTTSV